MSHSGFAAQQQFQDADENLSQPKQSSPPQPSSTEQTGFSRRGEFHKSEKSPRSGFSSFIKDDIPNNDEQFERENRNEQFKQGEYDRNGQFKQTQNREQNFANSEYNPSGQFNQTEAREHNFRKAESDSARSERDSSRTGFSSRSDDDQPKFWRQYDYDEKDKADDRFTEKGGFNGFGGLGGFGGFSQNSRQGTSSSTTGTSSTGGGGFAEFFSGLGGSGGLGGLNISGIISNILEDKDKMLIAMMLFVLWRQKADMSIIIALGYVLLF